MANVLNGIETSPKISIAWVGCTNVTDRWRTDDIMVLHEITFLASIQYCWLPVRAYNWWKSSSVIPKVLGSEDQWRIVWLQCTDHCFHLQLQDSSLSNKRKKFAAWWAAWRSQNVSVEQERHGREWLRQTQSTRLSRFRAREKRLWFHKPLVTKFLFCHHRWIYPVS